MITTVNAANVEDEELIRLNDRGILTTRAGSGSGREGRMIEKVQEGTGEMNLSA